uniref:choice-of-anchor Q domain-containing protein n=1 Tax=Ulvibacterium marinum TaxID=2419782 RepID=UPI003741FFA2
MALELSLNSNGSNEFNYSFINCLLKFRDNNEDFSQNPLYDFGNTDIYDQILLNQEVDFINTSDNNFNIGQSSAAIDNANFEAAQAVPFDIKGINRATAPDIGAYENITPE